jgi:hypothetical protein
VPCYLPEILKVIFHSSADSIAAAAPASLRERPRPLLTEFVLSAHTAAAASASLHGQPHSLRQNPKKSAPRRRAWAVATGYYITGLTGAVVGGLLCRGATPGTRWVARPFLSRFQEAV